MDKVLPTGSIVRLREEEERMLVTGVFREKHGILYDYSLCAFPEGVTCYGELFHNAEDIEEVCIIGSHEIMSAELEQYLNEKQIKHDGCIDRYGNDPPKGLLPIGSLVRLESGRALIVGLGAIGEEKNAEDYIGYMVDEHMQDVQECSFRHTMIKEVLLVGYWDQDMEKYLKGKIRSVKREKRADTATGCLDGAVAIYGAISAFIVGLYVLFQILDLFIS